MTDIEVVKTFYSTEEWKRLFPRRHYVGKESGKLFCRRCRWAIRFVATAQRLFTKIKGVDETIIEDANQIVRVVVPYCPQCDSKPSLTFDGMVYANTLTKENIPIHSNKNKFIYREIEFGHFVCDPVFQGNLEDFITQVVLKAVIETTELGMAVPDQIYELALLEVRLGDPKYRLRCKYEETKAARAARVLAAQERQQAERERLKLIAKKRKMLEGED